MYALNNIPAPHSSKFVYAPVPTPSKEQLLIVLIYLNINQVKLGSG